MPAPGRALKDPKSMRGFEESYYRAFALVNSGDDQAAIRAFQDLRHLRVDGLGWEHLQPARAVQERPVPKRRRWRELEQDRVPAGSVDGLRRPEPLRR